MDTRDPKSERADDEQVSPQRAAKRLYDEMAIAYREQAEDDLALNRKLLPASVGSTLDDDDSD
jgi:hypothetical protein